MLFQVSIFAGGALYGASMRILFSFALESLFADHFGIFIYFLHFVQIVFITTAVTLGWNTLLKHIASAFLVYLIALTSLGYAPTLDVWSSLFFSLFFTHGRFRLAFARLVIAIPALLTCFNSRLCGRFTFYLNREIAEIIEKDNMVTVFVELHDSFNRYTWIQIVDTKLPMDAYIVSFSRINNEEAKKLMDEDVHCAICLETFKKGQMAARPGCHWKHLCHRKCALKAWRQNQPQVYLNSSKCFHCSQCVHLELEVKACPCRI